MTLPLTDLQQIVIDIVGKHQPAEYNRIRDEALGLSPLASPNAVRNAVNSLVTRKVLAVSGDATGRKVYHLAAEPLAAPLERALDGMRQVDRLLSTLRAAGRWVAPLELVQCYPEFSPTRIYGAVAQLYRDGWLHRKGKSNFAYRAAELEERAGLLAARRAEQVPNTRRDRVVRPPAPKRINDVPIHLWATPAGSTWLPPALLGTRCRTSTTRNAA